MHNTVFEISNSICFVISLRDLTSQIVDICQPSCHDTFECAKDVIHALLVWTERIYAKPKGLTLTASYAQLHAQCRLQKFVNVIYNNIIMFRNSKRSRNCM